MLSEQLFPLPQDPQARDPAQLGAARPRILFYAVRAPLHAKIKYGSVLRQDPQAAQRGLGKLCPTVRGNMEVPC